MVERQLSRNRARLLCPRHHDRGEPGWRARIFRPLRVRRRHVYDAPTVLDGRRFDVVYTGSGALCWLPDIHRWARTVANLLRPGGWLHLAEFHPLTDVLDDE